VTFAPGSPAPKGDPLATTKSANHDDFTLGASIDLDALGETDADPANDVCPRAERERQGLRQDRGFGRRQAGRMR
jgi:hypothetical protein